ncbi:MAG: tripartite tricarboxylate transporter substrate-binding protein [Xanthobacteraceae bacterium]
MEHLQQLSGTKMLHVPFSGDVPAITAVLSGDVSIAVVSTSGRNALHHRRKVESACGEWPWRCPQQGAAGSLRSPSRPIQGLQPADMERSVAAKGTPPDVVKILNKAVNEALAKPDVIDRFAKLGLQPLYGDAAKTQEFVRTDTARKKQVIERIGLKRE